MDDIDALIRNLVRDHGAIQVTVGATLLSMLLSVVLTHTVVLLQGGSIGGGSLVLSILIPAIIAPLMSYKTFSLIGQLDQAERRLHALSTTDELTGAFNRRYFLDLATLELERAERYQGEFSIAIMDFDNFKLINDRFGHLAGDRALREVSQVCRDGIRETDIFARYGGDEFIFLFPQTNEKEARECLLRVMDKIIALSFESGDKLVDPHVSIGVHAYGPKSRTLDAILEKADLALYKSKQMGGSKVSW